ncbi:beta-mannosyltransferase 4 isoform X1 [Herrania umbratica]|uniref:Beta-mannosyltransferase 4 isoform X1 n=1 Tax=Herrania umbratica TaxID=108875 RepID=A0A6J1BBJ9_9ROSI|nr:beta-mannosyltransferase 4 isoform X1 [Herrania umbratica]
MAMRSALSRFNSATRYRSMESTRGAIRYLSDDKGRILSEEERAKENVYIQKMERERLEKKKKAEKEKAEKEKEGSQKATEEAHKG